MPDRATPVGTLVQPMKPPPTLPAKTSTLERAETKSDHPLVAAVSSPPSLSNVLYKESYNAFMKKKNSVVFTSHCWTPHQSIYVGCEGGQVLLADSETGTIKVVANPCISQVIHVLWCSFGLLFPVVWEHVLYGSKAASNLSFVPFKRHEHNLLLNHQHQILGPVFFQYGC